MLKCEFDYYQNIFMHLNEIAIIIQGIVTKNQTNIILKNK